jgi:phage shock protein A
MGFFGWVVSLAALAGVVFLLIWFVNRRAGNDLFKAGRAQVGKLGAAAKNADPKAVLDQEIRDAESELNESISSLEESNSLVAELSRQVNDNDRDAKKLDLRVQNSLRDDPDDKGGKAAQYVMDLNAKNTELVTNKEQLASAKKVYESNLARFRNAKNQINAAQARARNLGVELKQSETNAKIARIGAKFNVNTTGLSNAVSEAEAETRRQIDRNNAVSQVQTDLGLDGLKEAEEEDRLRRAEAASALEDYRKKLGSPS